MLLDRPRRLPGFRFEVQAPTLADVLPRMDIPVFVGFALAGPLHTPIPVEDVPQFEEIFGGDMALAWDATRGKTVHAHLARTVRAFFHNGGRRCWIVRIASEHAETSSFAVPGLLELGSASQLRPAFAFGRSAGNGFDSISVGTSLLSTPIGVLSLEHSAESRDVTLTSHDEVVAGDLLRLTFSDSGIVGMLAVRSTTQNDAGVTCTGSATYFLLVGMKAPSVREGEVTLYSFGSERKCGGHWNSTPGDLASPVASADAEINSTATLVLDVGLDEAPKAGEFIRAMFGADEVWLMVQDANVSTETSSPLAGGIEVVGRAWWQMAADGPPPAGSIIAEKLRMELIARNEKTEQVSLAELGFGPENPLYWNALPDDATLFHHHDLEESARATRSEDYLEIWSKARSPRFPLSGSGSRAPVFLPLGISLLPEFYARAQHSAKTALERAGLDEFGAELFLDEALIEPTSVNLLNEAEFLQYQSPEPRRLRGIQAAFPVEEATMISVPDAVQPGWEPDEAVCASPPGPFSPLPRPHWWHFKPCFPKLEIELVRHPEKAEFLPCELREIEPPQFLPVEGPDAAGTFAISWTSRLNLEPNETAQFILEEATQADFAGTIKVAYSGADDHVTLYGRRPGTLFYRVRAVICCDSSDWSERGVAVCIPKYPAWKILERHDNAVLTAVHRALIRMSAARADLVSILSLPESYREEETLEYLAALRSPRANALTVHGRLMLPLGNREENAFSYAACYHPWLSVRKDDSPVYSMPPDGAACGILARRALSRGAWIAAANELIREVVALQPAMDRHAWLDLQEAGLNLIRHEAAGFMVLSAQTLSSDEDVRPLNVRRLLILLRRYALRAGAGYVFEPNDRSFRRLVQQRFETMLGDLYARGAFAGNTAADAFEVNTGDDVNPPASVDAGLFVVELKIAPSLPLTFLTLRLVQTGERAQVAEVRR